LGAPPPETGFDVLPVFFLADVFAGPEESLEDNVIIQFKYSIAKIVQGIWVFLTYFQELLSNSIFI